MTLVVDVGTNAEIVLGDKRRLLAASSPTGPAFEGAQISGGQRAAPGAIERVRIDPATLEPRFRVIGVDAWSDEEAFATGIADTGITGICGSGIIEVVAEMFLAGIVTEDGVIDGGLAARTPRIVPDGRTFSYILHEGDGSGRRAAHRDHPDRRPRDPARQGRALRRRPAADGPARDRRARRDPPGRRLRQPDRPGPRDDPRAHPRLRPRPRPIGRQRGRDGRPHRPPVGRRADRDRGRRPAGREDRDRRRAALPAALRRGDGLPAQDRGVPEPRRGRGPARTRDARPRPPASPTPDNERRRRRAVATGPREDA